MLMISKAESYKGAQSYARPKTKRRFDAMLRKTLKLQISYFKLSDQVIRPFDFLGMKEEAHWRQINLRMF